MSTGPSAGSGRGRADSLALQLDIGGASQMALNFGMAALKQMALAAVIKSWRFSVAPN